MRKTMAVFVLTALCIGLCACGATTANETAEPSIAEQMYEKYESIINKLEAEDYDAAMAEIAAMRPEPTLEEVEITADNFLDYYELVLPGFAYDRDAKGNPTRIKGDKPLQFKLRNEYNNDTVNYSSGTVTVGVEGIIVSKVVDNINWETGEVTIGDEEYDPNRNPGAGSWVDMLSRRSFSKTAEGGTEIYLNIQEYNGLRAGTPSMLSGGAVDKEETYNFVFYDTIESYEIVSASGTLVFQH